MLVLQPRAGHPKRCSQCGALGECAIRRSQQYDTVVLDLERTRVVWIARGRDEEALRGFFTSLGPTRCTASRPLSLQFGRARELQQHEQTLERMAYGFRDEAYFFLRFRAAFPGIPG